MLGAVRALAAEGWRVIELPVDAEGGLDQGAFEAALDDTVALVTMMHGNNETGVLFDVASVAERAHAVGALVHVDAGRGRAARGAVGPRCRLRGEQHDCSSSSRHAH